MERMSTLDAGFFFVEHTNVPMHLGSLVVFEGPSPSFGDLRDLYAAKLALVPRYRQVVRTSPFNVFRPVWADDVHFDISYHLRHAVVPKPGAARQLRRMAEQVFAQPLDRSKPLWETWLLEGLQDGRWAILSKVHHCVVDGIGGSDLMAAVFDWAPDAPRVPPAAWQPRPGPSAARVVASGVLDALTWPLRQFVGVPGYVHERLRSGAELLGFGRGLGGSARRLAVPSASSLNGPIGPGRRWVWTTSSLSRVKSIRQQLGGTVNDVLLAAITSGFRDLLAERGELREGVVVRSLVPISIRGQAEHGVLTNRVSAVLVNLPVAEPDPLARLSALRAQMDQIKRTHQVVGAELLTEMLGFAAPTLLAIGTHAAFQVPQPLVQTVTTNVPGPRFPLYILGRQMTDAYPYVPIGDNVRISIAIYSYLDRLSFGVTADHDSAPDVGALTGGIRRGLTDLSARSAAARRAADGRGRAGRAGQGAAARAHQRPGTGNRARESRLR